MSRCEYHLGHPQIPRKKKGPWNREALEQDLGAIKGKMGINRSRVFSVKQRWGKERDKKLEA